MWYLAETEQHDEILYKKIANLFVRRAVGVSSKAFASGGFAPVCSGTDIEVVISSETFSGGVGTWSNGLISTVDSNAVLGFFDATTSKPSNTFTIPASASSVLIDFNFLEKGTWDGGDKDTLGITVSSPAEGESTVSLGGFHYLVDESAGRAGVTSETTGIGEEIQTHAVSVGLPSDAFSDKGETITLTIDYSLTGAVDESLAIDNFRVVACIDTIPSASPSDAPTKAPTPSPTMEGPERFYYRLANQDLEEDQLTQVLGMCEGDCIDNYHCQVGFECWPTDVPGCDGSPLFSVNYCGPPGAPPV